MPKCKRRSITLTALLVLSVLGWPYPATSSAQPLSPDSAHAGGKLPAAKQDNSAGTTRREQRLHAERVTAVLDEIEDFTPDHRAFIANNDQAQIDAMQAIEDFRERMSQAITAELIVIAADSGNSYATRTASNADRHANYTAQAISAVNLDRFRNSGGRDDLAIAQYFLMAYRAEQMQQLARLYPDSAPVAEALQVANAAMEEVGSLDSVIEGRQAAQAARMAEMRLYPAVRSDPATEQAIAAAFASSVWTQGEFAGSEIVRVHLISEGWTVRRNPVTGVILSRDQRADLGVRRPDGRCFSYVAVFQQTHQGGGYGGTFMASGRDLEMLCENMGP